MNQLRRLRRLAIECAVLATERCLEALGASHPSALLILGHMRSGSTLLLHLLMTNSMVEASGERGAAYASRVDLARLALVTRLKRHVPLQRLRYVADQVNHNNLTPNYALLQDPRVTLLFLLRRPQRSLASIVELYRVHYQQAWSTSQALEYYVKRLQVLRQLGESLPDTARAALITYEGLTETPTQTLEALRTFLGLTEGFSQSFKTHSFTGSWGDPGPNITAGRIIQDVAPPGIQMDATELDEATTAYKQCARSLERFALGGNT